MHFQKSNVRLNFKTHCVFSVMEWGEGGPGVIRH